MSTERGQPQFTEDGVNPSVTQALAAWRAERDAWMTDRGVTFTWSELHAEHRRRAEAHWAEHPEDRVR